MWSKAHSKRGRGVLRRLQFDQANAVRFSDWTVLVERFRGRCGGFEAEESKYVMCQRRRRDQVGRKGCGWEEKEEVLVFRLELPRYEVHSQWKGEAATRCLFFLNIHNQRTEGGWCGDRESYTNLQSL